MADFSGLNLNSDITWPHMNFPNKMTRPPAAPKPFSGPSMPKPLRDYSYSPAINQPAPWRISGDGLARRPSKESRPRSRGPTLGTPLGTPLGSARRGSMMGSTYPPSASLHGARWRPKAPVSTRCFKAVSTLSKRCFHAAMTLFWHCCAR